MAIELKKCPFCGGDAKIDMNMNRKTDAWFAFVKCIDCNAVGHTVYIGPLNTRGDFEEANERIEEVYERAARSWNRRV